MLIKGAYIINASGGIGGNYYQRSSAGLHIKAASRKVKSPSTSQKSTHKLFQQCKNAWVSYKFTPAQIELWQQYAERHPRTNAVGDSYYLTVQLMFYRHNFIRVRNDLPIIYSPPAD